MLGSVTSPPGTLPPSDPWRLGRALEASIEPARRRATGAWYTPVEVASLVAGWALEASPAYEFTISQVTFLRE